VSSCPICLMPLICGECIRHDPDEIADFGAELRRRRDVARSALLKIWPKGKCCEHTEARRAFEALEA
jgi:hypothetical protein